jgi:uncharacterized repeat protein (TIGR03803 family)
MKIIRFASLALICVLAATLHAQSYKVLYTFSYRPSGAQGVIAQNRGGSLLTTALDTGANDRGVVFRVTTSGAVTVLHQFKATEGAVPQGGVTLGTNGQFYGTTSYGPLLGDGSSSAGAIFEMTPAGTVKILHEFTGGNDGSIPTTAPIQSLAGQFYGTTPGLGTFTSGTVYRINQDGGGFNTLHVFSGADGSGPWPVVQSTNDWFYGTAVQGGTHNEGVIFRISSSGKFEALYNFDGTHGAFPDGGLIQANDGNFYGATSQGGAYSQGVLFRMTPTHQVTVLRNFTGGSDGTSPHALIEGSDGYLYGISDTPNAFGGGFLFRISTSGEFTVLHNFERATGWNPVAVTQHTNGLLYGDTYNGGSYGLGVFYRYDLGLPPFVTYLPSWGSPGLPVDILGSGFTTYSQAFFNGVRAQIITVSPNYMRVVVPHGATSGWITVTTSKGTLKSNKKFIVHS